MKIPKNIQEFSRNPTTILDQYKKSGTKVVGFTCTNVPEEMIIAAGLQPYRISNIGANTSNLTPSFACPFASATLENMLKLEGYFSGFIIAHTCDLMWRFYDILKKKTSKPLFLLRVPHNTDNKLSLDFFKKEITRFKKFLEKKHDVAWMGWSTGLRPSFWQHYHSFNAHKSQTNNITNTDDPELDKLIDAFRNSLDEEERIQLSLHIQEKLQEIGAFVPTFMVPYVRQAYWRWWRLPEIPGTKHSGDLFDPFGTSSGGLFWYDKDLHEEKNESITLRLS